MVSLTVPSRRRLTRPKLPIECQTRRPLTAADLRLASGPQVGLAADPAREAAGIRTVPVLEVVNYYIGLVGKRLRLAELHQAH